MNFLGTTRLAFVLYLAVLATLSVSSLFADGAMAVLLVVVLIVLLLLIFVRLAKFTRAITRTVYAVDRFASGDFDYRISQRDVDSNGHIAASLNLKAHSIRSLLNPGTRSFEVFFRCKSTLNLSPIICGNNKVLSACMR